MRTLQSLAPSMAEEGIDLYVPTYLSRAGLVESRAALQRFIRAHRLNTYQRLHVFAFIAGSWTFNPLANAEPPSNLATVLYDRSPLQERAPRIAAERLRVLTWLRFGRPVFDLARTPYPPLVMPIVKVAILVETKPTTLLRWFKTTARSYGPLLFEANAFEQRYDDCLYLAMNHDELYVRFAEVWPEVLSFIRTGRFTASAHRKPPAGDPLVAAGAY